MEYIYPGRLTEAAGARPGLTPSVAMAYGPDKGGPLARPGSQGSLATKAPSHTRSRPPQGRATRAKSACRAS